MEEVPLTVSGMAALSIGYFALISAPFLGPISPLYTYGLMSLGAGAVSVDLYKVIYKIISYDKLYTIIKSVGLNNKDGKMPEIVRKKKKDYGCMYEIKMLPGQCVTDYSKHKEAFDQYFKAECEFSFGFYLILKVRSDQLKDTYDYTIIDTDNPLKILIGHSKNGAYFIDIAEAPHVLIAGTTGSGKSVLLRSIVTSLILNGKDINIHLVDFMRVELGIFKRSNRVTSFTYTAEQFISLMARLKVESEKRLKAFESKNITNIDTWNKKNPNEQFKKEVIIVDEYAAMRNNKTVMDMLIERTAQDRKCGIHYVLATQRPTVDVISGTIKANIPVRIALKVTSNTDSMTILDCAGAEKLRGKGNALVKIDNLTEIQTMFLEEEKAIELIQHTYRMGNETESIVCDTSGVVRNVNRKRSGANATTGPVQARKRKANTQTNI